MPSNIADPADNGAVLNIAQLIKAIMSLAAEAELSALYINACEAVPIHLLLAEMGHIQPPTPTQTNNSTALGVVNSNIQPWQMKAMDMRFHWLRCREAQQVQVLLACRQNQLGQLLDQTSLCRTPRQKTQHHPNPAKHRHSSAGITPTHVHFI